MTTPIISYLRRGLAGKSRFKFDLSSAWQIRNSCRKTNRSRGILDVWFCGSGEHVFWKISLMEAFRQVLFNRVGFGVCSVISYCVMKSVL